MTRTLPSFSMAGRMLLLAMLSASPVLSAQRDRTPPTAPANLVVTATTTSSVTLAWQPSTDNSGRFSYIICCAGSTVTVSQAVTSHTLEGLKAGTTYTFRVYARDAAGNLSKPSNPVTVTLPGELARPTKPVVQALEVGPTHASLNWSSTDDGTLWYSIYIDGRPVSTLNSRQATFVCSSVLVETGCVPVDQQTTYTFTVAARDADGNVSPLSDPVVLTTDPPDPNDQTPPTEPVIVAADNDGGHIVVSWEPSTDDFAPQALIRYDVYVNGQLRAVVVGDTIARPEGDFNAVNDIEVIAVDTADNESFPGTTTIDL